MAETLLQIYKHRYDTALKVLAPRLQDHIAKTVSSYPRIDKVIVRPKSIERFLNKSNKQENGAVKYSDPINQIQDQLGARIVTFYLSDIEEVRKIITDYFAAIEQRLIIPDSIDQFGYEGLHLILFIPDDLFTTDINKKDSPRFFELQIKSLFQHAWAEANHDLGYKTQLVLSPEQNRKIAFTAAQAWGADTIFDELYRESYRPK